MDIKGYPHLGQDGYGMERWYYEKEKHQGSKENHGCGDVCNAALGMQRRSTFRFPDNGKRQNHGHG